MDGDDDDDDEGISCVFFWLFWGEGEEPRKIKVIVYKVNLLSSTSHSDENLLVSHQVQFPLKSRKP